MFRKCSIQKVYDSMHGISTKNVQISEAVEIMAYCLMDGKVKQKSTFESQLYDELLKQMMEALPGRFDQNDILERFTETSTYHRYDTLVPKETLALVWIYLHIIGKPADQLLDTHFLNINCSRGLFDFLRKDFKTAIACLMLDDDGETDSTVLNMRDLILKHFKSEKELTDWSKDIFKQVTLTMNCLRILPHWGVLS